MSAAGHSGFSPRALSRTHAGKPISRNGAKTLKSLRIMCQMKIRTKAKKITEDEYFLTKYYLFISTFIMLWS